FFYAGAKSLVVSHWEVDSEATVALMNGLFSALRANPRLSHAEALRLSMLGMITNSSTPEWAQPEFWRPFVLVGEPMKKQPFLPDIQAKPACSSPNRSLSAINRSKKGARNDSRAIARSRTYAIITCGPVWRHNP